LKEEGFNLTLINDLNLAEQIFKPENYDLVLIGYRMAMMDCFDLYHKLHEMEKKYKKTQTIKQFSSMFYDCIYNKLFSISRDASRI
jgi:DNA-binding response OmpR family regulator